MKNIHSDNPHLSPGGKMLLSRRDFLHHGGSGLGAIALAAMLGEDRLLARAAEKTPIRPIIDPGQPSAPRLSHFQPRAKNVLVIHCSGALSHLDSWDYKPDLIKYHGQPLPGADDLITFQGEQGNIAQSHWEFKPRGESGKYISDLLPNLAELADEMCFIHSMTGESNTHGPAENQLSTGFTLDGFPSMGAWSTYALGSDNQDLPSFVAIPDPRGVPQSGPNNWASGFLPAVFQGVAFNADKPIPNLARPDGISPESDRATMDFLKYLNEKHLEENPGDTDLSARIATYELAAKMQIRAAEVGRLEDESPAMRAMYGVDQSDPVRAGFARNCLLARRLIERGVRFVQLINGGYAMGEGVGNWDGHKMLKEQYSIHAPILDKPVAALLRDMKARGLLEETVVAFVTEFGRMPTFQKGASGRDHNPAGFTAWLAGAGVKRAHSYGATDNFGHKAAENVATWHDFHATLLHILGLDHERLTFYHNGIERRLTNVHGNVIHDVLA